MASATIDLVRDTTLNKLVDAVGGGAASLDGTQATYNKRMRQWFIENGALDYAASEDYASLTALVDKWYEITRDDWCGWTEFYQPDVSAVTYGTKGGDNANLTCTPSTDTEQNTDDYAGLPLFACTDCNWYVDEITLRPVITAIDGITNNFKRSDPTKYVGVLQMAGYVFQKEDDETYTIGYAANRNVPYANVEPLAEAVNPDDNSVRSWVLHAKYGNSTYDGLMTSCKGLIPTGFLSHNSTHTLSKKNGTQYSGTCACDISWLQLMMIIKYESLTLDGISQGCVNNNYQYIAQVAEEGVKRVLISSSHNLEVGMGVLIGNYTSSTDRGSLYSITGQAGAIITKITTVTVDDTEYAAVYVDMSDTFDTAANGAATAGTTYISTYTWLTGTTDGVLGNDGSPTSCTSGKYPAKLQGIEYMYGQFEVVADAVLQEYLDDDGLYYYEPYLVDMSANQSTSVTSNYVASGIKCEQQSGSTATWEYIKRLGRNKGIFFPVEVGGSSSTYTRDSFYMDAAESTNTRTWAAYGRLQSGSNAGISCLNGNMDLTVSGNYLTTRLSPNGNRGEWSA